ncbi:antitoxin [Pseudonocardia humida]|uniref:Antitoxin n=1 Tax=Pseudonocardia humida TaxID=2800819 RepID=A0ABT0ZVD2_9PSEU|nr:antitoxin [Pseudonocardia humida]MCO1654697.1 antitoxin [Pseudonocardia humida]
MDFINKAKDFIDKHDEQVDQALDKAGDFAKTRFAGHDQQIDQAVDKAQEFTGQGDTTRPAAPRTTPPPPPA